MARIARAVVAGVPHHVTQRGNRRQPTFLLEGDYRLYRRLMGEACRTCNVAPWAYCLMPNHVHLVLVPRDATGLAAALGRAHRAYVQHINRREGWTGHLWQGRFSSCALDEAHLIAAVRYVERNPVRAGLVPQIGDWPWSSVHAHRRRRADPLCRPKPLLDRVQNWDGLVEQEDAPETVDRLRRGTMTGRPLGEPAFVARIERQLHRVLAPARRGPKPRASAAEA